MKTSHTAGIGVAVILAITLAVAVIQMAQTPGPTTTGTVAATGTLSTSRSASQSSTGLGQTTSASGTSEGSTSGTHQTGSPGHFAMMATDPPIAASGVSSATVTYNGLAIHSAGSASASGWTQINGSGSMNLMSSENVSQTIAAAQVQSGTYDMVAMNVTSGSVVYNGQTYAAAIASGEMYVHLTNDVQVNSSTSSAAIVDLRTFIVNTGNSSNPQFVISASAKATAVPASDVTSASTQVGSTFSLNGQTWWTSFEAQTATKLSITSATLSGNNLNLQVDNNGQAAGDVQTIVVTPVSANASATTTASLPASMSGSAVFTVTSTSTIQTSSTLQGAILLNSTGTSIGANSSSSLDFNGNISINASPGTLGFSAVVPGQTYLVTVMGANTFANIVVVAQ
jgi:hypothetical protein